MTVPRQLVDFLVLAQFAQAPGPVGGLATRFCGQHQAPRAFPHDGLKFYVPLFVSDRTCPFATLVSGASNMLTEQLIRVCQKCAKTLGI